MDASPISYPLPRSSLGISQGNPLPQRQGIQTASIESTQIKPKNNCLKPWVVTIAPILSLLGGAGLLLSANARRLPPNFQKAVIRSLSRLMPKSASASNLASEGESLAQTLEAGLHGMKWLPKSLKKISLKGLEPFKRNASAPLSQDTKVFQALASQLSRSILAIALVFSSINSILSGLNIQQPSMLLAGILEFIPAALLLKARSNRLKAFTVNLWMLTQALWTVGFSNDLANKSTKTGISPRQYDMSRFESALKRPGLSTTSRLKIFLSETGKILGFILNDPIHLLRETALSLRQGKTRQRKNNPQQTSATLARLSVILTTIGAVPLLIKRNGVKPAYDLFFGACKTLALLLANFSLFNMAREHRDLKGMAPLLGVPLTLVAHPFARNDLLIGLGNIGEGLNSSFTSDLARKSRNKADKMAT